MTPSDSMGQGSGWGWLHGVGCNSCRWLERQWAEIIWRLLPSGLGGLGWNDVKASCSWVCHWYLTRGLSMWSGLPHTFAALPYGAAQGSESKSSTWYSVTFPAVHSHSVSLLLNSIDWSRHKPAQRSEEETNTPQMLLDSRIKSIFMSPSKYIMPTLIGSI